MRRSTHNSKHLYRGYSSVSNKIAQVGFRYVEDTLRELTFWEVFDITIPEYYKNMLLGATINIEDYLNPKYPLLVFPVANEPKSRKVFDNLYFVTSNEIPENLNLFIMNDAFVQTCLPKNQPPPYLTLPERINMMFRDTEGFHGTIVEMEKVHSLKLVGVYGGSPIHYTRGVSEEGHENTGKEETRAHLQVVETGSITAGNSI